MNVLAIDTSVSMGSAALFNDRGHQGEVLLNEAQKHSEHLMDQIDFLLKNTRFTLSQIDGFAVTVGPGSFTGLRVGITTAKTLAMACGKKILGINTLDLLALGVGNPGGWICPVINAFRGDVYAALYESKPSGPQKTGGDLLIKSEALMEKLCGPTMFTGEAEFVASTVKISSYPCTKAPAYLCLPRASVAAEEAYRRFRNKEGVDCQELNPYYIRRSDAEEKRLRQL
jgi:tRNA threonylcarbamoyladenosine biosynthesis protein TsaB